MVYKKKKMKTFVVGMLLLIFIGIIASRNLWAELGASPTINLVRAVLFIVFVALFVNLIIQALTHKLEITEYDIVMHKNFSKEKVIPIESIHHMQVAYINSPHERIHYAPKGRERFNLMKGKNSVLFDKHDSKNQMLWDDRNLTTREDVQHYLSQQQHLSEEEKQHIQYQKDYEESYIAYENAILETTKPPKLRAKGTIPEQIQQAESIFNTIKYAKQVYDRTKTQSSANSDSGSHGEADADNTPSHSRSRSLRETIGSEIEKASSMLTTAPFTQMKFPYAINDVDSLSIEISTTTDSKPIVLNLCDFANPIAMYSHLYDIAHQSTNRIHWNDSEIDTQKNYIPSMYRKG